MTSTKFLLIALIIFAFAFPVSANTPAFGDTAAQIAQVTELDVNGIKVLIKRRPSAPTVAVGLFIKGGSRNITDKNAGIENLMLASAVEAGKKFNQQTVRRELSSTGSGIGSAVSRDYSVISMATTRPNFDKVWSILTDVSINPTFDPADIERRRNLILTGLRESESNPEGALETALDRTIYTGHPYANDVNGTAAIIQGLTVNDLRAHHQKIMQTSRLLLILVGDLDPEDIKARVAASFGKLPRGDFKDDAYPSLDFSKPTLNTVARANLPTSYAQGVFSAPNLGSPDYYAMRVAMAILQSLVYLEVRERRQLSYAPGADLNNLQTNTGNISVSSTDVNESVKVMLEQIRRLQTMTYPDEFIDYVAGNFLTTYYLGQETSAAQVGELARYEITGGGWRNYYKFLDGIRQVKSAEVKAVSNKYMKNLRFVVVGNPAQIDKTIFTGSN